jgi:hypothetical protein
MLNETLFHAEEATFRAVTGSAYNIPNAYGEIVKGSAFPTKGTMPSAVTREGTFKSEGKAVRGTNSQFTKLLQGSYLYNGDVLRQIDHVVSDDLLFLKQAFPADVSVATTVKVCDRQFYKKIYAKNTHASTSAIIQEAPLVSGDEFVNGGAPVAYDASGGGQLSFTVHQ